MQKKIGIKFCGGCRAAYDRRGIAEQVAANMQKNSDVELDFEIAKEGETYDDMLVMCGCTNRCANVKPYTINGEKIYIWGEESAKPHLAGTDE